MIAAAISISSEPCAARQRPHGNTADMHSPVCTFVAHSDVPSLPNKHGAEDMPDSTDEFTRRKTASADPRHEMRTKLQQSFSVHVADPAKVTARKVAAAHKTVEAHKQSVPQSWAQMIAYARAYPAFALDVMELMGLDIDQDRNSYALFLQLQKTVRGE